MQHQLIVMDEHVLNGVLELTKLKLITQINLVTTWAQLVADQIQ